MRGLRHELATMTTNATNILGILFDLGDTLVHFAPVSRWQYLETAAAPVYRKLETWSYSVPSYPRYLRKLKRALVWAFVRDRIRGLEVQILPAFEGCHRRMGIRLTPEHLGELRRMSIDALRSMMEVDEACHEVIHRLHDSGFRLGLVSNTLFPGESIDQFLQSEDLLSYFPVRIYSSDVHYRKPHRRIFEAALTALGLPASRTLFVGDRLDNDIAGPAKVGMKTALFLHDRTGGRSRVRPDYTFKSLTDLLDIVTR